MAELNFFLRVAPFVATTVALEAKVQTQKTFFSGILNSIGVVFATELGDKTFFVAAILATKYELLVVYLGCWGALAFMTLVSAVMGALIPSIIGAVMPASMAKLAKVPPMLLLLYFGGTMIYDAIKDLEEGKDENIAMKEELEDAKNEIDEWFGDGLVKEKDNEADVVSRLFNRENITLVQEFFVMTFLAEWGDKSQIATVAMSTTSNPVGVALGGILGHAACTGIAVATGRLISEQKAISESHISLVGGTMFVAFALHTLITL
mmetsp:Transcript_6031/g.7881  ORF Transcript_6031/g.7881 Transcript_6031/m.7881 type:complete len:264 (+) Transcript_6031:121-912(+)|eukprot:CAMPEP_0184058512 /NCGR_PEP_ID=MMETSP0956-20121227/9295_1 /TAXON_ID=627963 /ORGANISM="Aplanochytrium sp, Strain PBS07" /LENGTH=263 /DNA_ID=CAMNT_0026353499 /DNA_START=45 /DNA_END=836 /DNA_ORIENTATION=+